MKKRLNLLKKLGILTWVASFLVGPMIPSAQAGLFGGGGISIPSPSAIAGELENRYHINVGSVQDQGEALNVGSQKKSVPEVSLSFSPSDPKIGEKITANALPSFFASDTNNLYFSWYLKRKGCDTDNSPSADVRAKCDNDNNGRITVNDWKIEAMRTLAMNGFDNADTPYRSGDDTDNDGYKARFGGDDKVGTANNYCAMYDASGGSIYEIVQGLSDLSGVCSSGLKPTCVGSSTGVSITPGSVSGGFSGDVSGSAFTPTAGDTNYSFSGFPQCTSNTATCNTGTLRCLSDPRNGSDFGSAPITTVCTGTQGIPPSDCNHLFAKAPGFTSGDADFGVNEEEFWHTDPKDPSTAQNGNKDEANVVGLGQTSFTWNYDSGDKVGVVVEGTAMVPTKHDDASAFIMWGFSKNNCPLSTATAVGAYTQNIRGYGVSIPAVTVDLNDCLEKNLVDPTEGGQPGHIEVSVTADPENPVNDESGDNTGDIVTAAAVVTNSSAISTGQLFQWTVSIANNSQFDNTGAGRSARNVTADLKSQKLLGVTDGSGLTQVTLPMNILATATFQDGKHLSDYVDASGIGYMRFSVNVSENVDTNVKRKGRSDVIVKFQTIHDRIGAYQVSAAGNPLKLSLISGVKNSDICSDTASRRTVCPVVKNEIIGLRLGAEGFTNYNWTVNGKTLSCPKALSDQCSDDTATNTNFLPIFGETGDMFTVAVDAVDIVSGKKATLSRIFQIIDPSVMMVSADTTRTWPKFLGQYKDASGYFYSDLSRNIFQTFSNGTIRVRALFSPGFLKNHAAGAWTVDGVATAESSTGEITVPVDEAIGSIYNISYQASVIQSPAIRRALQKFWNVSVFDSGESTFSKSIQVEVLGGEDAVTTVGFLPGSKKFAALASYIPASVLFTVKAFFSMALILLISGFMMAVVPETLSRRSRE